MSKERNVNYRAIHTKNAWRKARHESIENALGNRRGARALFAGKAAIDYGKQGTPLYVIVWEEGAESGFVVKPNHEKAGEILKAELPMQKILEYEAAAGANPGELEAFF